MYSLSVQLPGPSHRPVRTRIDEGKVEDSLLGRLEKVVRADAREAHRHSPPHFPAQFPCGPRSSSRFSPPDTKTHVRTGLLLFLKVCLSPVVDETFVLKTLLLMAPHASDIGGRQIMGIKQLAQGFDGGFLWNPLNFFDLPLSQSGSLKILCGL